MTACRSSPFGLHCTTMQTITMGRMWLDMRFIGGTSPEYQQQPTNQDTRRGDYQACTEFDGFCFVDDEIGTEIDNPLEPNFATVRHEQHLLFDFRKLKLSCNTLTVRFSQIKPPSTSVPLSRHQSSASLSSVSRNQNAFAQSVGPGLGRSNSTIGRAQTSMSFHPPTNTRQRSNTSRARPQTAMNTRPLEDDSTTGKKNCTMPSPSQSHSDSLQYHKHRKAASVQSIGSRNWAPSRDVSISTMMGKLSLDDERAYDGRFRRNQAISAKENQPPSVSLGPSSIQMDNVIFKHSQREEPNDLLRQENSRVCTVAPPKTPLSTAYAQKMLDTFEETLLASTKKYTESPTKSPSKTCQYLTKDSNLRAFTAWDMDERLIEVEAQFKAMKEVMNGSLSDKKAMEEVIEMAKTRGGYTSRRIYSIGANIVKPTISNANEIDSTKRIQPCRTSWMMSDSSCRH